MKKGFTLIELIGVITILGVIMLLATPTIKKVISEGKEELYNIQTNNIEEGLKNWAIDNNRLLPLEEGKSITLTLGHLKVGSYVESELKNPKTNKCFSNDILLTIKRYQKNYIYIVNDETIVDTDNCNNYMRPYIILKGAPVISVETGSNYIEPGVTALDLYANDISGMVVTSITGSGNTIDTSIKGNEYIITYSITDENITVSANRTVIIV